MLVFKQWLSGLRLKFLVLALIPMIGFCFLTLLAIHSSNKLGEMLNTTYQELVPSINVYNQLLTTRMAVGYNSYAAVINADNEKARTHYLSEAQKYLDTYIKLMGEFETKKMNDKEKEIFSEAMNNNSKYTSICKDILKILRQGTTEGDKKVVEMLAQGGLWHASSTIFSVRKQASKVIVILHPLNRAKIDHGLASPAVVSGGSFSSNTHGKVFL